MIGIMDRRPPVGRLRRPRRRRSAWRRSRRVAPSRCWSAVRAGAGAASSSPPVPAGLACASSLVTPLVYPGGGIDAFGDRPAAWRPTSPLNGSDPSLRCTGRPRMAAAPTGDGMWLAGADGWVATTRATRAFHGSLANLALNGPIVGMAATPDRQGYWLVALDGGVFAFGDAGSTARWAATRSTSRSWAWPPPPTGTGYWLVAADGGIFAFGDAAVLRLDGGQAAGRIDRRHGRHPRQAGATGWSAATGASSPSATPLLRLDGRRAPQRPGRRHGRHHRRRGYWLVGSDGGVFTFGDAVFHGSPANGPAAAPRHRRSSRRPTAAATGSSSPTGGTTPSPTRRPTAFAGSPTSWRRPQSQVQPDPDTGVSSATPTGRARSGAPCSPPGPGSRAGSHPLVRLHRQHLQLGRQTRPCFQPQRPRRPATPCSTGPGRPPRALGPHGDRRPGVARRRHRHHRG